MNKGIGLAALSGILYGCLGYFGKVLSDYGFTVTQICLWRFIFSTLCFIPILPFALKQKFEWKSLLLPFLLGGLCYSTSTFFYFQACPYIGSGLAMVIFFTYPILVVLISSILHRKQPTLVSVISSLLILVGCALIAYQKSMQVNVIGVGLSLLSASGYGFYVALSKNVGKPVPPLIGSFAVCLGNSFTFLILTPFIDGAYFVPTEIPVLGQLTLFGLFGTLLPVLLLLISMKTISATTAAIISVFEPITSLTVGFFILDEPLSFTQLTGAMVILASAILTIMFGQEEKTPIPLTCDTQDLHNVFSGK